MVKNLVYQYQIDRQKFEDSIPKKIRNTRKSPTRSIRRELPEGYDPNWSIKEKTDFMRKKFPPPPWAS